MGLSAIVNRWMGRVKGGRIEGAKGTFYLLTRALIGQIYENQESQGSVYRALFPHGLELEGSQNLF